MPKKNDKLPTPKKPIPPGSPGPHPQPADRSHKTEGLTGQGSESLLEHLQKLEKKRVDRPDMAVEIAERASGFDRSATVRFLRGR